VIPPSIQRRTRLCRGEAGGGAGGHAGGGAPGGICWAHGWWGCGPPPCGGGGGVCMIGLLRLRYSRASGDSTRVRPRDRRGWRPWGGGPRPRHV